MLHHFCYKNILTDIIEYFNHKDHCGIKCLWLIVVIWL